jgi:carboxymethylenebutenolidase
VPDLFYREGEKLSFDPIRTRTDEAYRAELMRVVTAVTPEAAMADTDAVLQPLSGDAAAAEGPMVCVGYCMGARLALRAMEAKADGFAAAACIHPGKLATDDLARIRGEVLVAFAEVDQSVSAEDADEFRREFEAAGVEGAVERWPGTHGFAMADLPMYDEAASEQHFARTLELWRRALSRERAGA